MAKKRGSKAAKKAKTGKNIVPKMVNAEKAVAGKIGIIEKKIVEEGKTLESFFSKIFKRYAKKPKSKYRKKEEGDLRRVQWGISDLVVEKGMEKTTESKIPVWFYLTSVFAAFLFTLYISLFATIHFGSIEYMNITIVFLFIAMVSYFLIAATYFLSEKKTLHWIPAFLFFAGVSTIMVYAFKAIDTSDLVRYSIIYTIIVAAVSTYVLAVRR